MIPRTAEATIHRLAKGFPVICVTGPRQSGKTTLARVAFPDKPYISLEDPDIARLAREDPRGLLDGYKDGLILDEAQAVPEIFQSGLLEFKFSLATAVGIFKGIIGLILITVSNRLVKRFSDNSLM